MYLALGRPPFGSVSAASRATASAVGAEPRSPIPNSSDLDCSCVHATSTENASGTPSVDVRNLNQNLHRTCNKADTSAPSLETGSACSTSYDATCNDRHTPTQPRTADTANLNSASGRKPSTIMLECEGHCKQWCCKVSVRKSGKPCRASYPYSGLLSTGAPVSDVGEAEFTGSTQPVALGCLFDLKGQARASSRSRSTKDASVFLNKSRPPTYCLSQQET